MHDTKTDGGKEVVCNFNHFLKSALYKGQLYYPTVFCLFNH